jgi:hypothetical protein
MTQAVQLDWGRGFETHNLKLGRGRGHISDSVDGGLCGHHTSCAGSVLTCDDDSCNEVTARSFVARRGYGITLVVCQGVDEWRWEVAGAVDRKRNRGVK